MCLILFAYKVHPNYPLILAANRDEFYDRPATPAHFWHSNANLLAGKDLQAGGTWMGMTRGGKFAALTNYREPKSLKPAAPSRGGIVLDFLLSSETTQNYLKKLANSQIPYNKFNLLIGSVSSLFYYSNVTQQVEQVTPGIHGLCNHLLDTPWPKVLKGKSGLRDLIKEYQEPKPEKLLALLSDTAPAPITELPDTGVDPEIESMLSSIFIKTSTYGSRASTILWVDNKNKVNFMEITFNSQNATGFRRSYQFVIQK